MDKIKIGVVGVGYLGKYHAEKYASLPEVELVGVVDTDSNAAREIAARLEVPAFSDYKELYGRVDAVSIVVPTILHYRIAKDFLSKGVDVLVEKPMTSTIEEADELIRLAGSGSRILQVGHLERFNAALLALDGALRNPMFIEAHRLAPFKDRGTDVDVILDIMIHDLDIILKLTKSPLTSVRAVGVPVLSKENNDIANVRLEFESGCVANVTASRISAKEMRKIRVFQQDAYLSIDFADQKVDIYRKSDQEQSGQLPISFEQVTINHQDALLGEIKSFLNSVKTRCQPEVPGEAGREALKLALSIVDRISDKKESMHLCGNHGLS